jgi:ABC-type branched-subunit amino acid transport system substrate-binding protein
MRRIRVFLALLAVLPASCTGGPEPSPSRVPVPGPSARSPWAPPITLDVVAATDPSAGTPEAQNDRPYLDGMALAVREVNEAGGVGGRPLALRLTDDSGDPAETKGRLGTVALRKPIAVLYVGPGQPISAARESLIAAASPVVLLEGDLYTSRELFRQVFQTSIPWEWQAHVIARYLVRDRKSKDIVFVGSGPEAGSAATATSEALRYWGGRLAGSYVTPPMKGASPPAGPASEAGAAIVFGSAFDVHGIVGALATSNHPPRIAANQSLLVSALGAAEPPAGTTACYTYTWAGWSEPIARVGGFIDRFTQAFGHAPVGFEQEGYDAVRTLAYALGKTGGRGGNDLVTALEGVHRTFSSFPVDLGPDDHLFLPRDELGLFAVPGPNEKLDPWQESGPVNWRVLMRTFTSDGERDNFLDRDRPVFFPGWKATQPGPEYWRSRYGIVTRPSDELH